MFFEEQYQARLETYLNISSLQWISAYIQYLPRAFLFASKFCVRIFEVGLYSNQYGIHIIFYWACYFMANFFAYNISFFCARRPLLEISNKVVSERKIPERIFRRVIYYQVYPYSNKSNFNMDLSTTTTN